MRPPTEPAAGRVVGYDVARALAVCGMVVVHFSLVAAADRTTPGWMANVLAALDGRPAAIFVVLAGVGVTLASRRAVAARDPAAVAAVRATLVRRGLFLLAAGFVNLTVWSGDILRVYGVSLMMLSRLIDAPGRRLLGLAAAIVGLFVVLVWVGDFERNWDFTTLTYRNLWTPAGAVRNLFYDGFRSVLPWTGQVLFGMWLGRLDLTDGRTNSRVLAWAAGVAVAAEAVSKSAVAYFLARPATGLDAETVRAVFGTESLPALPLFQLSAGGTATAIIAACVRAATRWPGRGWGPLTATGQMAFTWYVLHIFVGLGTLEAAEAVGTESLPGAAGLGLAFCVAAVLASWAWRMWFRLGPVESAMRAVTG